MQQASYVRLYADEGGASHFEGLEIELLPVDFAPPAAPLNVAQFVPATQTLWVGAAPEWSGEAPHPSLQRQVFCTVRGEYEVTASDGALRRFPEGHSTRVTSPDEALIFAAVVTGATPPDV